MFVFQPVTTNVVFQFRLKFALSQSLCGSSNGMRTFSPFGVRRWKFIKWTLGVTMGLITFKWIAALPTNCTNTHTHIFNCFARAFYTGAPLHLHMEFTVYAMTSCGKPINACLLTRNIVSGVGTKLNTRSAVTLIVPGIDFSSNLPRANILLSNPPSDAVDSIDSDFDWKLSRSKAKASSSNPCTAIALSITANIAEITNNLHFILSSIF